MNNLVNKSEMLEKLRNDILSFQGYRAPIDGQRTDFGLGPIEAAFPNHTFPTGAVHEFISDSEEGGAATSGFMATLLGTLMRKGGFCLWISINRTIFPPGLAFFGVEPHRIIFVDLKKEQDLLWAIEESLKCKAVAAVVGEIKEITLTESRRLQLAVEQSRVTGLIHRANPRSMNTLASVSKWRITPIPSQLEDGMPGVGHPRWNVKLMKVRNGEPGEWDVEWSGKFSHIKKAVPAQENKDLLQTG
ncbi:ImuA family protein [Dyadobacter linearis]|nr:Error-prone repair protein ImuA [Dyadobacter sp. CECT 9623]